ncbi:hypothetical protein [Pseudomonas izuensis]|uniref:Transposase n=1 Tax=Pseudomonas izuensis TaxID=2684212 RepID=A0ABM7RUW1_9PSED|nr:hypothetical protein [Pseudomonas izuensis]BCX69554.1 hypothetical protein LAB08_R42010 [Pseudomonas izuensis]
MESDQLRVGNIKAQVVVCGKFYVVFNTAIASKLCSHKGFVVLPGIVFGHDQLWEQSLLAMDVNDNACCLTERVVWTSFASRLAPRGLSVYQARSKIAAIP